MPVAFAKIVVTGSTESLLIARELSRAPLTERDHSNPSSTPRARYGYRAAVDRTAETAAPMSAT